jgi:hypothetical protein
VKDRPGHDRRYAIDARKIERELGWKPAKPSRPASARRCSGTWQPGLGGERASGAYRDWVGQYGQQLATDEHE